jgi:hypothetical protein
MRSPRSFRRATAVATALLTLAALVPATPGVAAGPTASIDFQIGRCGMYGEADLGTDDTMVVKHTRFDGTKVQTRTVTVAGGTWSWNCPGPTFRPGDRLRFFLPGATAPFRTFSMPKLQFRIDRAAKVVKGAVPGTYDSVDVNVFRCDPSDYDCAVQVTPVIDPAPTTGAWSVSLPGADGLWYAILEWQRGDDQVGWSVSADQLTVRPGSAVITGVSSKDTGSVKVTVRRGTKVGSGSATFRFGEFRVVVRRNGTPMKLRVGDVVTANLGPDTKPTVPPHNLYTTDAAVAGRCFKGGEVTYEVHDADGVFQHRETVPAESVNGTWSNDDAVPAGYRITSWCANLKGDILIDKAVATGP